MNAVSSRSHTVPRQSPRSEHGLLVSLSATVGVEQVVMLTLEQRLRDGSNIVSRITLGDLAGSERVKKSERQHCVHVV
jgi:hypothetical protein